MHAFRCLQTPRLAVAAALLFGAMAGAHAAPVDYDDRLPGQDFAISRAGLSETLLTLDAGQNIVRGREISRHLPFTIDADGFRFQLGADLRLDSIFLEFSFAGVPTPGNPNPNVYCNQWQLRDASGAAIGTRTFDPLGACDNFVDLQGIALYGPSAKSGDTMFSAALPLTDGIFELITIGGQFGPGGGELDYTFTFKVTDTSDRPPPAVPEPASATLVALALTGIVSLRNKRRER